MTVGGAAPRAAPPTAHRATNGKDRALARKRPTINDVAAVSGVSTGTVSRVLNGHANVSLAAELAVRRAVDETGYVVNRAARSLKTSRTGSVVMVVSEPQERLFEDPNFPVLLRAATRRLAERDMSLVLMVVDDDGHGIAPHHRADVFGRFVRLDEARARDEGGAGLGLAIVREIVEVHGGTVSAGESPDGGARFVVTLPGI